MATESDGCAEELPQKLGKSRKSYSPEFETGILAGGAARGRSAIEEFITRDAEHADSGPSL